VPGGGGVGFVVGRGGWPRPGTAPGHPAGQARREPAPEGSE